MTRVILGAEDKDVYGGAFLSPEGEMGDVVGKVPTATMMKELKEQPLYQLLQRAKKTTKGKAAPLAGSITALEKAATGLGDYRILARSLSQGVSTKIEDTIIDHVVQAVQSGSQQLTTATKMDAGAEQEAVRILRQANIDNIIGNVYEMMLTNAETPYSNKDPDREAANATWDYPTGLGGSASNFQGGSVLANILTDAKTRFTKGNVGSLIKKVKNSEVEKLDVLMEKVFMAESGNLKAAFAKDAGGQKLSTARDMVRKLKGKEVHAAAGGSIFAPKGTDTVPAMLTPGEFVVNKKSAQSFGYGNLKKINQYAKGGVAATGNVQYLAGGTDAEKRARHEASRSPTDHKRLNNLYRTFDTLEAAVANVIVSYEKGETTFEEMEKKVDKFGRGIKKTQEAMRETDPMGTAKSTRGGAAREALERVR